MKKIYLLISMSALLGIGVASSKTITPEEALSRLEQNGPHKVRAVRGLQASPELVHTSVSESGTPATYVFANPNEGYMILSADDMAYPLLGYSDHGTIDPDNMPDAMRWWLDEYARQIEYGRLTGQLATAQISHAKLASAGLEAIEPQIKSHWDQGEPYNRYTPVVSGSRSYTGCVATAMAQIMYYWKYPEVGTGSISYNDDEGCGKRLSWNFSRYPLEWDKMLPDYVSGQYTEDQANAVSILMKSCGAAVKMSYGADSSGALSIYTQSGFVKYFKYDPNLQHVIRSTVQPSKWAQLIYDNLKNVGPVLYGGSSMLGGGHSFVCDGYDGNGYFHFNWGWSEMSDGYFSLEAMNPSALGTGGGSGGGYNFSQDAVLGIQPPTGTPAVEKPINFLQMGTLVGEFEGSVLSLSLEYEGEPMWVNYTPSTVKVHFGVIIEQQNVQNPKVENITVSNGYSIQTGYGANVNMIKPQIDFSTLSDLPDGQYKVTIAVSDDDNPDAGWIPMNHAYGSPNYVLVTKSGNTYTVAESPYPFYTINSIEFEGGLYYGCLARVKFSVTNNTDMEMSRGFAPILFTSAGSLAFMGEGVFFTLAPGETKEETFVTDIYAMSSSQSSVTSDTQFYLSVFEETNYYIMVKEHLEVVTMHANPGLPNLTITPAITIKNAKYQPDRDENGKLIISTIVEDPSNIEVSAGLKLTSGIVAYPTFIALLSAPDATTGAYGLIDYQGDNLFMSNAGDTASLSAKFNFKDAVPGEKYYLQVCLGVSSSLYPVSDKMYEFKIAGTPAGVENVSAEDSEISYNGTTITAPGLIELYNVQGVLVASAEGSLSTAPFASGIYVARCDGRSVKIVVK